VCTHQHSTTRDSTQCQSEEGSLAGLGGGHLRGEHALAGLGQGAGSEADELTGEHGGVTCRFSFFTTIERVMASFIAHRPQQHLFWILCCFCLGV
jgi:hypothetical protein